MRTPRAVFLVFDATFWQDEYSGRVWKTKTWIPPRAWARILAACDEGGWTAAGRWAKARAIASADPEKLPGAERYWRRERRLQERDAKRARGGR